jgi:hypothetical protein
MTHRDSVMRRVVTIVTILGPWRHSVDCIQPSAISDDAPICRFRDWEGAGGSRD